jgi:glycosyltransferase involved in cell wall biosynthesis
MAIERSLCISTLDLEFFQRGGVVTKCRAFARMAEAEGFSPFLLTPSLARHRTVRRRLKGEERLPPHLGRFDDWPCWQVGAIYPEFESNAHRFETSFLESILPNGTVCVAVSGNNHAARPFLDTGRRFGVWPGSTFWEDCRDRIRSAPWSYRKVLDLAGKPTCEGLERRIFHAAEAVLADTTYTRDCILRENPLSQDKTNVVPVPVDCDFFHPLEGASVPTASVPREIVFIGRLSDPRKNLGLLFDAFELVGRRDEDARLVLMGSGDSSDEARIRAHPFAARIEWLRQVSEEEKRRRLQRAAMLVIPSLQEGFGITGAEALACGVPVVSTPCGGPKDFVIEGKTGLVLRGFDPTEMADVLLILLHDESLRRMLGAQGRDFAVAHLSMEAVRGALRTLIHSLAAAV